MNYLISAICPVRDETENIPVIFNCFRPLGAATEYIFVEGGSSDSTWEKVSKLNGKINRFGVYFRAIKQTGRGKAQAVVDGFNLARGKYLIIVDADLSINQTDLKKILSLITKTNDRVLACGNRLTGFQKSPAFNWVNYLGNYFFRYYYSFILNRPILDICCGSKAMTKHVWTDIKTSRQTLGLYDSWGDIDWLYYGIKVGCRITYTPVTYFDRKHGQSKLSTGMGSRWKYAFKIFIIGLKILFQH